MRITLPNMDRRQIIVQILAWLYLDQLVVGLFGLQ